MKGEAETDYRETLDYLFGLQRFGIKLGLENMGALLRALGEPHRAFPVVHIAGTNGKGSTAVFLASLLRQGGYRTGLYTSPHLIHFSERIQVDGSPIPTGEVVDWTGHIRRVIGEMERDGGLWRASSVPLPGNFDPRISTITFFEFTTALAFLHFRKSRVDVAVLEAGLGGRLDATNVVDPILSLITPLSLEHQQHLGPSLYRIAREKAGIIKPGRPLLTTARQKAVLGLLERRCACLKSPFYVWGRDFTSEERAPGVMDFRGRRRSLNGLELGLSGSHQVVNASLAMAGAEALMEAGFPLSEEAVRRGLAQARWPGRLELIAGPTPVLLDGAHNPGATRVLRRALGAYPRRRLIVVLGIMADKDIPRMMADLVPPADLLILTRPKMERAASLPSLREHVARWAKPLVERETVPEALQEAWKEARKGDLVLVTGSLFSVGEARAFLIDQGLVPP